MNEEQVQELKDAIKNDSNKAKRRSIINPIFWLGLILWITGLLFCITIIGLPLGIPFVVAGRKAMYKNNSTF